MAITVGTGGAIMPPVEALIKTAKRAEDRGYDAIWWPDHWMGWHPESIWTPDVGEIAAYMPNPHMYLDPIAAMAAAAVHTERVRLGTAVTEPIRRHPALLAHEWISLDHLSKGRMILGIGAGEAENNEPYGIDYSKQVSKLEEALEIIRLLWSTTDKVDYNGRFWTLRDAVCGLGPYGERPPPIWVGALGPRMLEICGRLGDGWLPTIMMPPEVWSERWNTVKDAATKAGRDPDGFDAVVYALTIVAETHEQAHELLDQPIPKAYCLVASHDTFEAYGGEHPFGPGFYGIRDYIPTRIGREEGLAAIEKVPFEVAHAFTAHGTPDELVAMAKAYEQRGATHIVLQNLTPLAAPAQTGASFRLLDDVVAALK
ncbi:MAG TPA: LLM class flavin-dependent oxidoreductase [Actinomycetota bacterium]